MDQKQEEELQKELIKDEQANRIGYYNEHDIFPIEN